jgi:hypothetical protein
MSFTQKLTGLLLRPRETIAKLESIPWEVYTIVGATVVARAFQKGLDIPILFQNFKPAGWINAFNGLIGVLLTWFAISFYFHFTAYQLGSDGKFNHLLSLMGYALFPYFIAIVISALVNAFARTLIPGLSVIAVEVIQITIEEGGLLFGIRGVLAFYGIQKTHQIAASHALWIIVAINIVLILYNISTLFF